jgi:hypothetical protein
MQFHQTHGQASQKSQTQKTRRLGDTDHLYVQSAPPKGPKVDYDFVEGLDYGKKQRKK